MTKSAEKIPPQNLDAEKSLLGAILISEDVISDVAEIVHADDFYDQANSQIFASFISLYERHRPIDLLTVKADLEKKKKLKSVGGATYLAELTNYVPTAAHAKAYAELVSDTAVRRRLIKAASEISEKAYEDDSGTFELLGNAEKTLFEASDRHLRNDVISIADLLDETFDRLETLHNNKGAIAGLKTGFADFDKITAGLHSSDLIILAARPAMGKTALALNIAHNVAMINNKAVLVFSLEMGKEQLINRMFSAASGIDSFKLETGSFSGDDFSQISEAMAELSEVPILIDDTPGMTVTEMRTKARRAAHDHDLGLIVIDYLQLMSGTSKRGADNRVQEVSEISRGLKLIARELNVPVIALSQLSRTVEMRNPRIPMLSDLRESGSIEQDADIVTFLYREDYYEEDTEKQNIADWIIAKHRRGATGKIELFFDKEHVRFMSLDKKHE